MLIVDDIFLLNYFNGQEKRTPNNSSGNKTKKKNYASKRLSFYFENDYIKTGISEDTLGYSTIAEIKEVLKLKQLPLSGKKAVLIERMLENFSIKDLETYFPQRFYLTEKSKEVVEKNKIYLINKQKNIGYNNEFIAQELAIIRKENPEFTIEDLLKRLDKNKAQNKDFDLDDEDEDEYDENRDYTLPRCIIRLSSNTGSASPSGCVGCCLPILGIVSILFFVLI